MGEFAEQALRWEFARLEVNDTKLTAGQAGLRGNCIVCGKAFRPHHSVVEPDEDLDAYLVHFACRSGKPS